MILTVRWRSCVRKQVLQCSLQEWIGERKALRLQARGTDVLAVDKNLRHLSCQNAYGGGGQVQPQRALQQLGGCCGKSLLAECTGRHGVVAALHAGVAQTLRYELQHIVAVNPAHDLLAAAHTPAQAEADGQEQGRQRATRAKHHAQT